jgi:hypothetical protein
VAAALGDRARAQWALDVLLPYSGLMVMICPGVVVIAPVDHALGVAFGAIGDPKRAVRYLESALAQEESMRAHGLVPRTQVALARVLRQSGDHARATSLLDAAKAAAVDMGLASVTELAKRVLRTPV